MTPREVEEVRSTDKVQITLHGSTARLIKMLSLVDDWDMDDIISTLINGGQGLVDIGSYEFKQAIEEFNEVI